MLDVNVPYRILIPMDKSGESVIERWDKQRFNHETRWIVKTNALRPWDELEHVELSKTLGVDEDQAHDIVNAFHEYAALENAATEQMRMVMNKIKSFATVEHKVKWLELGAFSPAGSPLETAMVQMVEEIESRVKQEEQDKTNDPQLVCVFCGNDRFTTLRTVLEKVVVDSNRVVYSEVPERMQEELVSMARMTCHQCEKEQENFVTQEFFHEVICADEYKDTVPIMVSPVFVREYEPFIGISQQEALRMVSPSVLLFASHVYDWNLRITLTQLPSGFMRVKGTVQTLESVSSEHVKTVWHDDIEVHCPEDGGLLGRYWFEMNGEKYSAFLMESKMYHMHPIETFKV